MKESTSSAALENRFQKVAAMCTKAEEIAKSSKFRFIMGFEAHNIRSRILKTCRFIFEEDFEMSHKVLEQVWHCCFYTTVKTVRKLDLTPEHKSWCTMLISAYVGELLEIANEFSHLRTRIFVHIGDLRRYSWLISGSEQDRSMAILNYRQSSKLKESSGFPFNQLALMLQDSDPLRALLYFLLADRAKEPFYDASLNISSLLNVQKGKGHISTFDLLYQCFSSFRPLEFDEISNKWLDDLTTALDSQNATEATLMMSVAVAAATVLAEKEKLREMRFLSEKLFRAAELLLSAVEEWDVNGRGIANVSRRRHASDSSESSSGSFPDVVSEDSLSLKLEEPIRKEVRSLLVGLLYMATSMAPLLYQNDTPTAYYEKYEEFCRNLTEHLITLQLRLTGDQESLWQLGGTTPWALLPRFLRQFADSPDTPVMFDEFFHFKSKSTGKENFMRSMGRQKLAHDVEEEKIRSSMPVYVVPEQEVLLRRLSTVKKIYTETDLVIVIANGILRDMDKTKRDKVEVREALRWMQGHMANGSKRMRFSPAVSPIECAEEIIAKMPASTSVVVTILTMTKKMMEISSKGITAEELSTFMKRYEEARKEHTVFK